MAASSPFPSPARHPPTFALVGREQQRLGTLRAAAREGRGHLVLVEGEAGIGETALVRAVTAEAASRGASVLVGGLRGDARISLLTGSGG